MPTSRPFARTGVTSIAGTENVGNLSIGTPTNGFASTGFPWWNGPDEDSGYVIAKQNISSGGQNTPIIGVTAQLGFSRSTEKTHTSFINLANQIGATSFANAAAAKTWLNSNGYWTSWPGIVTSNLIVHVDAGDLSSYSGSGTSWNDTSGNNNNGTLFNTPTYSSTNGGYFYFNKASSEYATIPNIGSKSVWTLEAWVKFTSSLNGQVAMIVGNQYNGGSSLNFTIGTNGAPFSYNIQAGFFDGTWRNTEGFAPTLNTWYQIVGTYDGSTIRQYVNGVANGGALNYTGTPTSGGEIRMMTRWDTQSGSTNYFDGNLAIARIYGKALTDSEVLQNFNAQRVRFGL